MNRAVKVSLAVVIAITLTAASPNDWLVHETAAYSIQYKADWNLDNSGAQGTEFILSKPTSSPDEFKSNVNLITQDLGGSGEVTLDEFAKLTESQLNEFLQSPQILFSTRRGDRHDISYKGKIGSFEFQWRQYFWIRNNKAYILTLTTEQASFADHSIEALKIMDTFRLK